MPNAPVTFRSAPEKLVSYDWYDVAVATGYKTLYCTDVLDDYVLVPNATYGDVGYTSSGNCDLDFDMTVKKPFTIEGDAIFTTAIARQRDNTEGSSTMAYTFTVYIRKYDGTTETDLGNEAAAESDSIAQNGLKVDMHTFKITVPKTYFKTDEILRVSLVITNESSEFGTTYLAHDPMGRTAGTILEKFANYTSKATIDIPFNIDE